MIGGVLANDVGAEEIDVPDDEGAGGEVVGDLLGECALGGGAVAVFAANFDREGGGTLNEFHVDSGAGVPGGIGAEGLATP